MYFSKCGLNYIQKHKHDNTLNLPLYTKHFCPSFLSPFPSLLSLVSGSFNNILYYVTMIIYTTCVLYSATETAFLCVFAQHQPLSLRWLHLSGGFCVTTKEWLAKQLINLRISYVLNVKFRAAPYISLNSSLLKCFLRCCSS